MGRIRVDISKVGCGDNGGEFSSVVYADRIDLLLARADILGGRDRALLKMYLERGSTIAQMAKLAGVSEATISRRIRKLMRILLDGEYITCLRNRSRFSLVEQAVVKDYFLDGFSQRAIARNRGVTVYRVRKTLFKIRELVGKKRKH